MKNVPLTLSIEVPDELDFTDRIAALESRIAALESHVGAPADESAAPASTVNQAIEDDLPKDAAEGDPQPEVEGDGAGDAEQQPSEGAAQAVPNLSPNDKLRSIGNA